MSTDIVTVDQREDRLPSAVGVFASIQGFEDAQRMAKALAASSLVPDTYQGNTANTLIALEVSQRVGASPMAVMQNLHIIHGRPSWSSQFVIAALNSCGRFSPLRFRVKDLGPTDAKIDEWSGPKGNRTKSSRIVKVDNRECVAWCYDKSTGDVLEGPPVTMAMAVAEGWYTKDGSKWVTMPDLMLRYRSAKFFGNLYAPDVLMGMHSADEMEDISDSGPIQAQQVSGDRSITGTATSTSPLDDLNALGSSQAGKATQAQPDDEQGASPDQGKSGTEPAQTRRRRSPAKPKQEQQEQQEQQQEQQQTQSPGPDEDIEDAQFEEVAQEQQEQPSQQAGSSSKDLF